MHGLEQRLRTMAWPLLKRIRQSMTVRTLQGQFTLSLADDAISKSLFCEGQYELELVTRTLAFLRSVRKLPEKGHGTLADVGANNGVISIGALTAGELASAVAIEPDPRNFALLQRNVAQNGLTARMTCLEVAVSSQAGTVPFELSESNLGDHRVRSGAYTSQPDQYGEASRRVISVPSARLDDLLEGRDISLIWMDVQGHEGHAMAGAPRVLGTGVPLVCEVWPYGLERAGTSPADFCARAKQYWKDYWVLRGTEYVRYGIDQLPALFGELTGVSYANAVFMR